MPKERIISISAAILAIVIGSALASVLINNWGGVSWQVLDKNLIIYITVSMNLIVLTVIFYLALTKLFKIIFGEKVGLRRLSLQNKLIVGFLALSIPSATFHLLSSGYMAYLLETWSQSQQRQLLDSTESIASNLESDQELLMSYEINQLSQGIPSNIAELENGAWLDKIKLRQRGGIVVYNQNNEPVLYSVSDEDVLNLWEEAEIPPTLSIDAPLRWKDVYQSGYMQRIIIALPQLQGFKLEYFLLSPQSIADARQAITKSELTNRFVERDLFVLIIAILITISLLILGMATRASHYISRGFAEPIQQLNTATKEVAAGDTGYQLDWQRLGLFKSDFIDLFKSFNAMSNRLRIQHVMLMKAAEDIRQSNLELTERNKVVELLFENINTGILLLSAAGHIEGSNRLARKQVSAPRASSLLRLHYREFLTAELSEFMNEKLVQLYSGKSGKVKGSLSMPSGEEFEIELILINLEGLQRGVMAFITDMYAEKRHRRTEAWRDVARRVAHEIKNPLTPIQLNAQRISRKYLEHFTGNERKILEECTQAIISEVSSLKRMVNDFTQFVRLPETNLVAENINDIVEEVLRSYLGFVSDDIKIELELGDDIPEIPLDRSQMKRVLGNLIDNALQSLKDKGRVVVSTALDADGQVVTVSIADNGLGIAEDIKDRVFEPHITTKDEGTGLGLSIVQRIIMDHQGHIDFYANSDGGTTFRLQLKTYKADIQLALEA